MSMTDTPADFDGTFSDVDDLQRLQATADATTRSKSLEAIFGDFVTHDATHLGEPVVSVGGEVYAPAGMLPITLSHFLDWAVSEGLLEVTAEGEALRSYGEHPLPWSRAVEEQQAQAAEFGRLFA